MRTFRFALLVALALTLAACGGKSAKIATSSLPELVLRQQDVGSGYQQFDYGREVSADQPPGARDLSRFGRVAGWIVRYHRTAPGVGPAIVESRTDLFASSNGAQRELGVYSGARPLTGIGERAVDTVVRQGSLRTITVAWQEQNAAAAVAVQGLQGTTLTSVLALARKQDALLRRAVR